MNKKRWLGVGVALVLLVISFAVPKYTPEIDTTSQLSSLKDLAFGMGTITENVIEMGDPNSRILALELFGTIGSGGSAANGGYDHEFMLEQLDKVLDDESIKGIYFLVDTPGGGVYESAEIRDRILKIKEEKNIPIYVQMLGMAASGGYYVSADATKIYATQESITGSIGVISTTFDITGLLDKYGVSVTNYTSGNMKAMGSPFESPSEEEKSIWQELINETYDRFVSIVANGRNIPEETVRTLADGRIYTANQALNNGLIDEIAFPEKSLEDLKTENGLETAEVFSYHKDTGTDFFSLLDLAKSKVEKSSDLIQLKEIMENHKNMPTPMYLYGGK
ncbi:MAG: signal peptide peptidase SppA [Tissierellia bacterium]|nr:signal peptide peptidase SppA [Tissierellia bacterium]